MFYISCYILKYSAKKYSGQILKNKTLTKNVLHYFFKTHFTDYPQVINIRPQFQANSVLFYFNLTML